MHVAASCRRIGGDNKNNNVNNGSCKGSESERERGVITHPRFKKTSFDTLDKMSAPADDGYAVKLHYSQISGGKREILSIDDDPMYQVDWRMHVGKFEIRC